jgi:hypothetical protein
MSDEKHKPWCSEQARKINGGCICKAESSFAAPSGSAATWRVTADDDREKEWDSDNCDDAFMDADQAFMDGARKVTIQIITPPNEMMKHGG